MYIRDRRDKLYENVKKKYE